ncbi:pyruvate dehydrogenase complex dihydrolipoamide acetyltransferase [Lewinella cohaerens]|uniref:pyruvate dehydrogenase complex dihydrolipoamide acetyltransferase n=1 Tax=Lewinella cohaerens TaxID=70995 RepID=UPI0003A06DC3|nr:pyruvate dehydrogenase complex dihydrolipoamide acetyltransferase [Lewinella cohaerens]
MAEVIRMPRMSDTMEEGNIIGWLKAEGETVEAGETLAEVETDKATMELDSYFDGVLLHIAVKEGQVPINGVIAVIGEEGEDWKAAIAAAGDVDGGDDSSSDAPAAEEESSSASPAAAPAAPESEGDRLKASPLARSMAKEANIDLGNVTGSGDQGRIVKRDIEAAIEQQSSAPAPSPAPAVAAPSPAAAPAKEEAAPAVTPFAYTGGGDNFETVPLSQMRKVIARRLGESKFTAPHFYLTVEINMDKAISLRKRINEVAPTKVSFNDLVIKASAAALRLHPAVNSAWMDDHIRINKDINIGVAVAVEDGLLVPVVRYADIKTLSQINTEVKTLAGKAKTRKLQPDEMQGNTFTISNLGMFGIEEFTAIINPPDAAILAVGGIIEKPIVKNGEIAVGSQMKVTLSCDHRVIDGATAAQFLNTFKDILEDPIRLMV